MPSGHYNFVGFIFRVERAKKDPKWGTFMTQGLNHHSSAFISVKLRLQMLSGIPSTMVVFKCEYFRYGFGFGDGTSPEGRPIMTPGSNHDCSSAIGEERCIQRLFGMPCTMGVPTCLFLVFVAGFGYGTSPEGPRNGSYLGIFVMTQGLNHHSSVFVSAKLHTKVI